jgi:hypothetical protein
MGELASIVSTSRGCQISARASVFAEKLEAIASFVLINPARPDAGRISASKVRRFVYDHRD